MKQGKGAGGERTWTKGTIDASVASVHTLLWADIDGDGKANELITGKRVYAHEIEPGATDGSLIAWYHFDPQAKGWIKHVIFQGEPAKNAPPKADERLALKDFPPGTAGTGTAAHGHRHRRRRRPRPGLPGQERAVPVRESGQWKVSQTLRLPSDS